MAVVVCSSCGKYSYESGVCPFCGSKSLRRVYQPDVQGSSYLPVLKERIISIVNRRDITDKHISTFWAITPGFRLLPLWSVVVVTLVADALDLYASSDACYRLEVSYLWLRAVSVVLFTALTGWLVYRLVNRLNEHATREQELRKYVMDFVRATAKPANKEQEIINELIQLSAFDGQSVSYERKHHAAWWGLGIFLLFLVGALGAISQLIDYSSSDGTFLFGWFWFFCESILSYSLIAYVLLLYLGSSLMRSLYTHEVRWKGFVNSTVLALDKLGLESKLSRETYQLRERPIPLYIFLTIMTLGFFGFYWLYVLIKDPNVHFESHRDFESGLIRMMRARPGHSTKDIGK